MLKTRIIPTLLWKDYGLVKGVSFDSWRRIGTVLPSIKVFNTRQVDELVLLDVSANHENREPNYQEIEYFSSECFVPLTVGGGIKNIDHVKNLLRAGADKVSINSAAYSNLDLIKKASKTFGSQCVVASIDVKKEADGKYCCYSASGTTRQSVDFLKWVACLEDAGAGEILLTSIDRDGTMRGYDLDLIKMVSNAIKIPLIASGGCSGPEDCLEALSVGGASALSVSSLFNFTHYTPLDIKKFLFNHGVPVRLVK